MWRLGSADEAKRILLNARETHPEEGLIYFHLARLACVAGDPVKAKVLLAKAIDHRSEIIDMVFDEEDLTPVWD